MEKLQPKLRFPEFEGNWVQNSFKDVSIFFNGRAYKQNELLTRGKYPVLRVGNLFTNNEWYFSDLELEESKYIDKDDLIYAWSASFGPRIWKGEKVIYHYHIWKVECNLDKINKQFYFYLLDNETQKMKSNSANGFALLHITKGTIENWKSYFPNVYEQQKIASFLTSVDERLTLLAQQKEKLELYKKGVMQQIFSQKLRFKDENGNSYPDWEEKKLGEVGNTYNGLTGKTKENFGEGKPYIQYTQIFSGSKININNFGLVQIDENENQSKVNYGDVFFTTSSETPNEIGTASVLLDEIDEVYLNSFCFGFRIKSFNDFEPKFAQFLFRSDKFRRKIIPLAQGSTRYNMSKVELLKLKIDLPCLEEQQKIASFLSAIDVQIEGVNNKIEQTKTFKKGLLQQMFV